MKTTSKLIIFIFALLALNASAYAQTPRDELQQMVEQLQKSPNDNALREKIIRLATSIKPALTIPETAREPFVMGATVLKKASDSAGASKAADLFTQALNIAPWFADAYYNRAIAREAAGQFELAIDDLKFYLEFKLTDTERREAQDKIYSLKADAQLASAKKAEQGKIASVEEAKHQAEQQARRFEGSWYYDYVLAGEPRRVWIHVKYGLGDKWQSSGVTGDEYFKENPFTREGELVGTELRFKSIDGFTFKNTICASFLHRYTLSTDGGRLTDAETLQPFESGQLPDCPYQSSYQSRTREFTKRK